MSQATSRPAPAGGGATVPASLVPELAHWQVAHPPTHAGDRRPLLYFAGTFYATRYTGPLNPEAIATRSWSEPDGTLVRRIDSRGEAWAEERWGARPVRLELTTAGTAGEGFVARRGPLLPVAAGNTGPDGTTEANALSPPGPWPGIAVLVGGLASWVRACDGRPLVGLRAQAALDPGDSIAAITVSAWHLPWGAVEFELYLDGATVGHAVAMLSCGPGMRTAATGRP